MKSPFVLPALCAAAMHAAFLFSPNNPDRVATAAKPTDEGWEELPSLLIFEDPPEPPDEILDARPRDDDAAEPLEAEDYVKSADDVDLPPVPQPDSGRPAFDELITLETPDWAQEAQRYAPGDGVGENLRDNFTRAVELGSLDKIPAVRLRVSPQYPHAMRQIGAEAEVLITFVVGTDGRVIDARADEHAPSEFAREAERAMRRWRFEPGTRHGRPVSFRMSIPLVFSITDR